MLDSRPSAVTGLVSDTHEPKVRRLGIGLSIVMRGIADVHVVVATVDPAAGHRGQGVFIVP